MATAPRRTPDDDAGTFRFQDALPVSQDFHLDTSHPDYIRFEREDLVVEIIGGVKDIILSSLRVTLKVYRTGSSSALDIYRSSQVDLFDEHQISYITTQIAERLRIESLTVKDTLYELTERLEHYRRNRGQHSAPVIPISTQYQKEALELLQNPDPVTVIEEQLEQAGISDTRLGLQLYLISLSRLGTQPLHALLHAPRLLAHDLVKELVPCLPQEKVREATTISRHALSYPPTQDYWNASILVLHQCDALDGKDNSLLDYILHGQSKRLVTQSNKQSGRYESTSQELKATISLIGYTDQDYHTLQQSRDVISIPVPHTQALQTKRYEREIKELAGYLNHETEQHAQKLLQQVHRQIQWIEVQNPLIEEINLSAFFGHDLKNLSLYLRLVNLITLLHQKKQTLVRTPTGKRIEVQAQYMIQALELFRELWLKKDEELYYKVRSTFLRIKEYLHKQYGATKRDSEFTLKDIRKTLKCSPATLLRHFHTLEDYGKIERFGGNNRTGYRYRVCEWDETTHTVAEYEKLLKTLREL